MDNCVPIPMEVWDSDVIVDKLISDYDETYMPVPDIEFQPHLLISKVRKHYMDYIIKLLSLNYETNQRLLNKNIYLPSAIWRCAKNIEMNAAQTCMMVQLYRNNVTQAIKDLKKDTSKGKLNRKLYEFLSNPPVNEKKLQTTEERPKDCTCKCTCSQRKRPRFSESSSHSDKHDLTESFNTSKTGQHGENANNNPTPPIANISNNVHQACNISPSQGTRMSIESQDSDELIQQLERLFQGDPNDDDIFERTLCDTYEFSKHKDNGKQMLPPTDSVIQNTSDKTIIDDHAAQIKSLDERLASLAGLLVNNNENTQKKQEPIKQKKSSSKWLCEEYFLKLKLHEQLDLIRDTNRKKLLRIKLKLSDLFGDDSDDEDVVSPLDETTDFVISCKERIAPWVVKLLTPYYIKGRIKGKVLFKALAKHLIRLIYQCSRYPSEYEVQSFVNDFLENHKTIRCEADFQQFKIDNLGPY